MTMVIKVDRGRRRTRLSKEREAEEGGGGEDRGGRSRRRRWKRRRRVEEKKVVGMCLNVHCRIKFSCMVVV